MVFLSTMVKVVIKQQSKHGILHLLRALRFLRALY